MKKLLYLLVFAIGDLLVGSALHMWTQWQKPSLNQVPVVIEVPKGANLRTMGKTLQNTGILQSGRYFHWYCRITGKGTNLKAGHFEIPPQSTMAQIAQILTSGMEASIRVTIPEGWASWEIFAVYKDHFPDLDSARWDSLVNNPDFASELEVPATNLEGWLFPDTYPIPLQSSEKAILTQMVRATKQVLESLDAGPSSKFSTLGGWQQVLTLASIVEEETGKADERAHVAGVFHNRLRQGIPLGADPTVRFIFRNLTGPIFKSQLASESPYNTRRFAGLPPGPISNPGKRAIDAALHPMETEDLYFVAKDDGSGVHFFAKTLQQHNEFKDAAARNRGE
jgi:UPF0755 protein